jgi:hypothetical protein
VGLFQITVKFKITAKVLLVTNVFGISPLLVWPEMTLEEAQTSDTHSLKGGVGSSLKESGQPTVGSILRGSGLDIKREIEKRNYRFII